MKNHMYVLILIGALALSACTLAEDIPPPPGYAAPTPQQTMSPSFPARTPDLNNGAALYLEKCAPCHGLTGLGDGEQSAQLPVEVAVLARPETARQVSPAQWFTVVTQGNLENFMPPFISMSEDERWDVVAYAMSLSTGTRQVEKGQELYEANCQECHGGDGSGVSEFDLSDQAAMARYSAADLYAFIGQGAMPNMPAFEDRLTEDERWALTAYLRTLTFPPAKPEILVSTPTPAAESAAAGEPSEVETTVTPEGLGSVAGEIINGSGGATRAGLEVTLQIYEHGQDGSFDPASTSQTTVNADGSYRFDDVELSSQSVYLVFVEYDGIEYQSEPVFGSTASSELFLPLTIYETKPDTSGLYVDRWHIFLNYTTPDSIQVIELFVISNPDLQAVVPAQAGQPILNFSLPAGASGLQFEDSETPGRFLAAPDGGFGDTAPILPGIGQHEVVFAFNLPYEKKIDFMQQIEWEVDSAVVMAPQGVNIQGDLLSDGGSRDFQGSAYSLYNSQSIPAGGSLSMTISGKPKTSSTATINGADTNRNLMIGVAALGIALILVGAWFYWRDRNLPDDDEIDFIEESDDNFGDADSLLDAIIALDDLYREGKLPEGSYQKRRAELKAQLKDLVN
ncbi:MAG: c-type cytochrome [Anaerolineales bacterium]|nr:c-type cytochrome [Anaerolineales bacterium]